MKIVHIIFSFTTGGSETLLVDILNEQVKTSCVSLIIINDKVNEFLLSNLNAGIDVICLRRRPGSRNPFPLIKLNLKLFEINPDVIHSHNHDIIKCLLFKYRKVAVLTLHSTGTSSINLTKYIRLFSISNAVKNDLYSRYSLSSTLVYNGIDTSMVSVKDQFLNSEKNVFKIVQVGRLSHKVKGQNLAIKAIKILKDIGINNIELEFIGEGESLQYLQKLTIDCDLKNKVSFLGLKDRSYIYSNLKNYDLLIQPSYIEGFGLTIVEAMAARIPVLISNIEGPMEVIQNGRYGYYFKVGDFRDLANKIQEIMDSKVEVVAMANTNREYVFKNFDVRNTAINYLKLYPSTKINLI